jgi:hypothetical protein
VNGGSPTGYRYTVNGQEIRMDSIFKHVAWTAIPLTSDQRFNFTSYCNIPTEARVSLRVNKAFRRDAVTNELPTFEFQMSDYAAQMAQADVAKASVKNQINIVPNPFYGRSGIGRGSYEANQLDNRVKITNLPRECTIRTFTLNGQVVRIFRKENEAPDQEWDLRNDAGVPIASGMYILHIDAKDFGEKILKFMCIMPQTDLNAY